MHDIECNDIQQSLGIKMDSSDFLARFEQLCELAPGTLNFSSVIEQIPGWGSLTFLGLIAMVDDCYSTTLRPRQLVDCATIGDLFSLIERLRDLS